MKFTKRIWHYLIAEPFTWLFYCFFQPAKFKQDVEETGALRRLIPMARMILPMFLCSFLVAIAVKAVLNILFPHLYCCLLFRSYLQPPPDIATFVSEAISANLLSLCFGFIFGVLFNLVFGVSVGLSVGIAGSITNGALFSHGGNILFGLMYGLAVGLIFGILLGSNTSSLIGFIGGFVLGLAGGLIAGLIGGIAGSIVGVLTGDNALGLVGGVVGAVAGALVGATAKGIADAILTNSTRSLTSIMEVCLTVGSVVCLTFGTVIGGVIGSDIVTVIRNSQGQSSNVLSLEIILYGLTHGKAITDVTVTGIAFALAFLINYPLGYYRLPLYLFSGISMMRSYFFSRGDPSRVFYYLHHSSLYRDERVFLPLPALKRILLIASVEYVEQTLGVIDFIIHERPHQKKAAIETLQEIVIRDLEGRESLRDISHAVQRLKEILPQEVRLSNTQWIMPFVRLEDASLDAANYYSPLNWEGRYSALQNMLTNLKKVYPNVALRNAKLNKRLSDIVHTWRVIAKHEQENLEKISKTVGQINNPYNPGAVLELHNNLFVGRIDLARQIGEALHKNPHTTFFLTGERRMGKTSALKQLPNLMGSYYLVAFYDLQSSGIASSAAAFLATIAEEIYEVMKVKGIRVKKLNYENLQEARRENEATVYYYMNRWLNDIERSLQSEDYTLILAFDEFEKLEDAGRRGNIDLKLLFDWFRSVIQNRTHLTLLFSGVKTIGEIDSNWATYFVNAETLAVSFLQPAEARRLITRPIPHFSGEELFNTEVVDEIIRVTACHPFLIQAVCSKLIVALNSTARNRAEIQDVTLAMEQVLANWWDTYFLDLWERTSPDERTCLIILNQLGEGSLSQVLEQCDLNEHSVHQTMHRLKKRDLVLIDKGNYRIAAPIFRKWIDLSVLRSV